MASIKKVPIEKLNPAPYNPRVELKPEDKEYQAIKNSIESFGYLDPIVWNENTGNIVSGHQRYQILKDQGATEIEVRVVHFDMDKEKACNLALNKAVGLWDNDKLNELLEEMQTTAWDMSEFGFDDMPEIKDDAEIVEDEVPEEVETRCKLGDVWKLGNHRLMCGDSTDPACVERLMGGAKADMVFTDPPYNVAFNGRSGKFDVIENDDISEEDFKDLITASCNIIRMLEPKAYYIWCNWKFYGVLQEQLDYKNCIVWAKNVFGLGKGYRHQHEFCLFNGTIDEGINNESDLWEIAKDANYVHPTQKPVALCARALKNHKNANVVVDLFGGSGSTLIACEQTDRTCYMMELDPHYCDVIIQRWENLTSGKAVKEEQYV